MPMVIVIWNSIGGKPCVLLFGNVHLRFEFSLATQNFENISKLYLYIISSSFWKCKSFVCLPLDIQIMQNVLNILWKTIIGGRGKPLSVKIFGGDVGKPIFSSSCSRKCQHNATVSIMPWPSPKCLHFLCTLHRPTAKTPTWPINMNPSRQRMRSRFLPSQEHKSAD